MNANISRARSLALLGAGAAALRPGRARAQAQAIRVGTLGAGDTYALPFYAQDGGFFNRIGLNAELATIANGAAAAAAIVSGTLEFGCINIVALASAHIFGEAAGLGPAIASVVASGYAIAALAIVLALAGLRHRSIRPPSE